MQYTIDAKGKRLGRLASEAAKLLNGKDSPSYTRNIEAQNSVHVINASALYIDPRKLASKSYSRFSGYPGGLKKEKMPKTVKLLIKNQAWTDERHWLGIVDHILGSGISPKRLILCHRGFSPNNQKNPENLRNLPDFEMAMRVKEKTGLPMLIDPSHIGGTVENVFKVAKQSADFDFDGMMAEVHPEPKIAKSDAKQQLTFLTEEFDE